ncbi:replication protein a-related [Anaeramoeba flamelloides]|uniref:Replication protein a-related n=1 Tax=Anaeramoeba flamelloides TaxID=1746091 RepID=A0AAV8AC75_9EUKA|nr:replication protein a-related [Anaeramoeba flamelloides]
MSNTFGSNTYYGQQNYSSTNTFGQQNEQLQVFGQENTNNQSRNYNYQNTQYNAQTVTPATASQLLKAQQGNDDSFFVDGQKLFRLIIIGILTKVEVANSSINCEITDGTGSIGVKYFLNSLGQENKEKQLQKLQIGKYVRILGTMKTLHKERKVYIRNITPITDHNEITHHFLNVIKVHFHNLSQQQQQQQQQQQEQQQSYQQQNPYFSRENNMNQNNMFIKQQQDQQQQFYQNQQSQTGTNQNFQTQQSQNQNQFQQQQQSQTGMNQNFQTQQNQSQNENQQQFEQQQQLNIYQQVFLIIKESTTTGGCGIEEIQKKIGLDENQLFSIVDYWINQGDLICGNDEKHWKANY